VSCGEFIGIAEETGLIGAIGEWVLAEACRQVRAWHDAGHAHLHVAVNVSPRQVRERDFAQNVARTLRRCGLPASALELEITESLLVQQTPGNLETLLGLAGMGVRLSIDDFGVGYSNLSYLRRFPIHALKIDRSFVSDVVHDANDRAIVGAIIAMSRSLGLRVIAEGVENEEQAAFLREHGCDAVQGFHFGRPVAPEALLQTKGAPLPATAEGSWGAR
jgi:EAL domain-containing protein (putative c-di-GMP-specific phosphodiesterase class I)